MNGADANCWQAMQVILHLRACADSLSQGGLTGEICHCSCCQARHHRQTLPHLVAKCRGELHASIKPQNEECISFIGCNTPSTSHGVLACTYLSGRRFSCWIIAQAVVKPPPHWCGWRIFVISRIAEYQMAEIGDRINLHELRQKRRHQGLMRGITFFAEGAHNGSKVGNKMFSYPNMHVVHLLCRVEGAQDLPLVHIVDSRTTNQ